MELLVVIDMQNDFIDGQLGTVEAQHIVNAAIELIRNHQGIIYYTQDTHDDNYLNTQEGRNLPVKHCIQNTHGWRLEPRIEKALSAKDNVRQFLKNAFSSLELAEAIKQDVISGKYSSIRICGICTDICVLTNALLIKSFVPEIPVIVEEVACAGTSIENHQNALQALQICQIHINKS